MRVDRISVKNFRNIENISIENFSSMNVICGENAQGKTNILEAIWLFTGAKSFRNSKDNALVKFDCDEAKNEIEYIKDGIENTAKIEITDKRTAFLNGKKLASPSLLAGNFNAIVFSPLDLSLVTDGPAVRRRFLDLSVGQIYPSYISVLRDYNKAVMQRNQTLREYRYDKSLSIMLDVFEEEIVRNGERIVKARKNYLERIKKYVPDIYLGLSSGREIIGAEYKTTFADDFAGKLKFSRNDDMQTLSTSVGPHRDDIEFMVNELSARSFGSQGQKRSIALAVKLSGAEVINEISGEYPICLLDDVMSELDPSRQNYILNHIKNWQCFLSCCNPNECKGLEKGKIFEVNKGEIKCISI